MSIQIQTEGRRTYLTGNTYPYRDRIRAIGAHWDAGRKAWWTAKKADAEALVQELQGAEQQAAEQEREAGISTSDPVIRGRAKYRGKTYYVLAHGVSQKTGKPYCKLAFRDGSRVFWARDVRDVEIIKEYREPKSIDSLRAYAEEAKRHQEQYPGHDGQCDECKERRGIIECQDSSGITGLCCRRCASLSPYERSFM